MPPGSQQKEQGPTILLLLQGKDNGFGFVGGFLKELITFQINRLPVWLKTAAANWSRKFPCPSPVTGQEAVPGVVQRGHSPACCLSPPVSSSPSPSAAPSTSVPPEPLTQKTATTPPACGERGLSPTFLLFRKTSGPGDQPLTLESPQLMK